MCVVCRTAADKGRLVRVARLADGTVAIDPTGKGAGRGAYVCRAGACWQDSRIGPMLGKALRTAVTPEAVAALRSVAEAMRDGT